MQGIIVNPRALRGRMNVGTLREPLALFRKSQLRTRLDISRAEKTIKPAQRFFPPPVFESDHRTVASPAYEDGVMSHNLYARDAT